MTKREMDLIIKKLRIHLARVLYRLERIVTEEDRAIVDDLQRERAMEDLKLGSKLLKETRIRK